MFKHARGQLPLASRLKLGVGSAQCFRILLEPTAVEEVHDPIDIEIPISNVLPEALA